MAKNKQANGQNRDIDTILGRKKNKSEKTVANLPQTARGEEGLLQLFREKEKKKGEEGLLQLFREKEKKNTQQTNGTLTGWKPQAGNTAKDIITAPQQAPAQTVTDPETARKASWDLFDSSKRWAISDAYTGKNRQQAEVTQGPEMPASEPAQSKTAEDISRESYQTILGNIGADVTGNTKKPTAADARTNIAQPGKTTGGNLASDILKGSAKQAGTQTGAQMPAKGAQASNNVSQDSYNKILSNITGKPADAKSQPAGGEVAMPEAEAQQPVQQPQAPVQQPAPVQHPAQTYSERLKQVLGEDARKVNFGAAEETGETTGKYIPAAPETGTSKRQQFYSLINGAVQKENEKIQKEWQSYKKELDDYIEEANPVDITDKDTRVYGRQYWEGEEKKTQEEIDNYKTTPEYKAAMADYLAWKKSPYGKIAEIYYEDGNSEDKLRRINAKMAQWPELFPDGYGGAVEYGSMLSVELELNNPDSMIYKAVHATQPETIPRELQNRMDQIHEKLNQYDEAETEWAEVDRLRELVPTDAEGSFDYTSYTPQMNFKKSRVSDPMGAVYDEAGLKEFLYYTSLPNYSGKTRGMFMPEQDRINIIKLYNAGMVDEAKAYYEAFIPYMNKQVDWYNQGKAQKLAQHPWLGWLAGLGTIPLNTLDAPGRIYGVIAGLAGDKEALDTHSSIWRGRNALKAGQAERTNIWNEGMANAAGAVFGEDAKQTFKDKEIGKKVANGAYSALNTAWSAAVGNFIGGAEAVGTAASLLMSVEGGLDTYQEQLENKRKPGEAFLLGVADGVWNYFTEKYITLENWLKPDVKGMLGNPKQLLGYIFKGTLSEESEEVAGYLLNSATNWISAQIFNHKPEIQENAEKYTKELLKENWDPAEAKKEGSRRAMNDWWSGLKDTVEETAISTMLLYGSRTASNRVGMEKAGHNARKGNTDLNVDNDSYMRTWSGKENVDFLIKVAKSLPEDTNAYQQATKLEGKKHKSNFAVGKLIYNINMEGGQQIQEATEKTTKQIVKEQLIAQNVAAADATAYADLIYKGTTQGLDALNKSEQKELMANEPAYQIFRGMMEPTAADISDAAKKTAKAVNVANAIETGKNRQNISIVQQIAAGKGHQEIDIEKAAKDKFLKAKTAVAYAEPGDVQEVFDQAGVSRSAASVIAYTTDAEGGNEAKAGKVVGFEDGKVKVQFADGSEQTMDADSIETTNRNAQKIIGYMKAAPGIMSDDVAGKTLAALDVIGDQAAENFAADAVEINLQARLGRAMPTNYSIREDIAEEIYNTAHNEYEQAEKNRIEEGGELKPGQGGLRSGNVKYGTKEWSNLYKGLTSEQKDQLYIANRVATMFGFDIDVFQEGAVEDENGNKVQKQGYQTGNRIGLNIAGKMVDLGGQDFVRNIINALDHEETHWIQKHSVEGYRQLVNFALTELEKSGGYNLEEEINNKIALYNKYYQETNEIDPKTGKVRQATIDDAIYEIVADSCDQIMRSKEMEQRLKAEAPEAHKSIKEFVRRIVERLSNAIKGMTRSGSRESQLIARMGGMEAIDEMARIWLGAYDEAIHNAVTKGVQTNNGQAIVTKAEKVGDTTYSAQEINDTTDILNDAKSEPKEHFSLTAPVEMRKDGMIAVHNLDERSILSDLAMKGFPMPSIAVLSDKVAWEDYGDISIFFGEDAVDFADGTVYSGDAYTPVMGKYQAKSAEDALEYLRTQKARNPHMAYSTMDLFNNYLRIQNIDQAREKTNAYWNMDKTERIANKRRLKAIENDIMDQVAGFMDQEENTNRYTRKEDRFNFDVGYGMLLAAEELNKRENLSQNEKYEILQESLEKAAEENGSKVYDYGKDGTKIYDDMLEFIDGASRLASTFVESKPNRVLGFGDVKAVVVPNSVQESTIQALEDAGVRDIITYDPEVKNARVEALASVPKNVAGTSFSIQEMSDGTKYVSVDTDQDIFEGHNESEYPSIAKAYIIDMFDKTVIGEEDRKAYVDKHTANHYAYPARQRGKELEKLLPYKMKAATELENMLNAGKFYKNSGFDSDHPEFPGGFDLYDVTIAFNGDKKENAVVFDARINIGIDDRNRRHFYDVTKLKTVDPARWVNQQENANAQRTDQQSKDNITQDEKNFKQEVEDALAHPKKDFSITQPVEATTGGLIAVHNLTYDNFMDTLKEEGFTAASIAVVKAAMGHSKYGDISVVFKKDAIDPQKNPKNKIYGADAYTPTRYNADVETELIYDKMLEIRDNLLKVFDSNDSTQKSLKAELERWFSEKTYKEVTNKTPEQLADEASNNEALMAAYLKDHGKDIPIKTREVLASGANLKQENYDTYQKIQDLLKENKLTFKFLDDVKNMSGKDLIEKYAAIAAPANERIQTLLNIWNEKQLDIAGKSLMRWLRDTYAYMVGGTETRPETDWYETKNAMREQIDKNDFVHWMAEKIRPAYGQTGIRNNLDPYTAMGNRRSFKQLHTPYTIENVVKAMYQNATEKGQGGRYATGAIATASKEYKTLQEVRDDAARLELKSEEEYDAIIEELNQRMNKMAEDFGEDMRYFDYAVMEAGRNYAKRQTLDAIKRGFADENVNISTEQAKKVKELLDDMREIPTGYFEAKPMRVSGFDEIAEVIVPEKYDRLIAELEKRNIPYTTTDGTEEARKEALNNVKSEQFSLTTQHPDNMDVRVWMDSVPESSLATEAEKELLRSYKGLRLAIDLDREKQRGYKKRIADLEAKGGDITPQEKRLLEGLKIRLKNSESTQAEHEAKMERITSDKGFAAMMRDQQQLMNDYVQGKTQDEVIQAVKGMEETAEALKKDIGRTAEELKALAEDEKVRQIRARMDSRTLNEAATRIRKNYNSTINKQELTNELAKIRLMIANNADADAITAEIEGLAGRILDNRKSSVRNSSLDMLRGVTIRLGDSALKEIYGTDSSLSEIRRQLAGSGIRLEQAKDGGSLDTKWDELLSFAPALDHYNGIETDTAENQAKAVAEFVKNAVEEQRRAGRAELEGEMENIIFDLTDELARINDNIPNDPKAKAVIRELSEYVREIAEKANVAGNRVKELEGQLAQMMAGGRKAANWSRAMKADVMQTIDYFNKTAKLAVDEAKRNKQDAIIQQLKDENNQKMMKANDEWRALIQRDADARRQAERNTLERKKMTVVASRLAKLLSNPTNTKNIPEVMNPLARKLVETLVNADLSDSGRKIMNVPKKNLLDIKRRLDAWNERDGVYNPDEIADENIRDIVNNDLEEIEDAIKEWNGRYSGKNKLDTLQLMGKTLERMREAVGEIYTIIQNQREISLGDRRVAIEDQAEKVRYQTFGKKKKEWIGKAGRTIAAMHKAIVSGNMTPEYFFRTLGNSGLNDLWEEYHSAENRNGLELHKAQQKIDAIAQKYGYDQWDTDKRTDIELEKGGTVSLTLGQMMSLLATWNREQTLGPEMSNHLEKGGFYAETQNIADGLLGKTTIEKKAHRVTAQDIAKIESILTEQQKNFVDEIVRFMSNDLSKLGNEASMKAYGIKMYKEKYYFPFQMWDGIKSKKSNDSGSAASRDRAFHPSFSKSRMHGANNALVIGDFMKTATDHAIGMINYATMGLANDTFQKVLNQKVTEGTNEEDLTKRNVRAVLEEAYGMEAMDYLRDLQDQMNGGAVATRKTIGDKLISLFRKNAVAGSLSVAMQQPLSYLRAALMINPKYLAGALVKDFKGSYKEMLEHSGVAVIKNMGRFDMGFGQSAREYLMPQGKQSLGRKIWEQVKDKSTFLPEIMDNATWTRIWTAVKSEQHDIHPEMDTKSDEFLDMCAVRFNDIIRRTQVYDSTLVKSRNMRSDNYLIKGMTSFMGEPTLTLNVLADAARQVKNGDKGAIGRMAGAGAVYIMGAILQAAFKGVMGAGRSPDDKKTFMENFMYKFGYNFINEINPVSQIPGYGDLINQLKKGEVNDDALAMIGKIAKAGGTGIDMLLGNAELDYRNIEDSVGQIVQLFSGVPAKNIMRDARAIYNFITQPYAKRETSEAVLKYQTIDQIMNADNMMGVLNKWMIDRKIGGYGTSTMDYYGRIYDAKKAGDTQKAKEMEEYLTSAKGVKEETVASKVKSLAQKDESSSAAETAQFMADEGMDPNSYILEQVKKGNMSAEEAEKQMLAANPDADKKEKNNIFWKVDRAKYTKETGKDASGMYYRFKDAIGEKDMDTFYEQAELILEHGGNTDDEGECVTDAFRDGKIDRDTATEMMRYVYNKDEKSDDDIWWTLDRIEYQQETGAEKVSGNYYRLYDAMDKNSADAIGNAVNTMVQHGMKKENIKTQIGKKYKQAYLEADNNGKRKIRDAMQKAYKKLGYKAEDADKTIKNWTK